MLGQRLRLIHRTQVRIPSLVQIGRYWRLLQLVLGRGELARLPPYAWLYQVGVGAMRRRVASPGGGSVHLHVCSGRALLDLNVLLDGDRTSSVLFVGRPIDRLLVFELSKRQSLIKIIVIDFLAV